jgi:hypothetical protein
MQFSASPSSGEGLVLLPLARYAKHDANFVLVVSGSLEA